MLVFAYVWRNVNTEFELSQSVRIVKKHYPDSTVVVIGSKPTINGVDIHIPHHQTENTKFERTTNTMKKLCSYYDEFILMYDDIFFNEKYEFTPKNRGELCVTSKMNTNYQDIIRNTRKMLEEKGMPTLNYECHQPEKFNSKLFLAMLKTIDVTKPHFFKTLYFNYYPPKETNTIQNLKAPANAIIKAKSLIHQFHCFSTGEGLTADMRSYIMSL